MENLEIWIKSLFYTNILIIRVKKNTAIIIYWKTFVDAVYFPSVER